MPDSGSEHPYLSVIVPVFNEEENLPLLADLLLATLESTGLSFEVLFVDDGSTDGSLRVMKDLMRTKARIRIRHHRRRAGLSAALATGFRHSRGSILATIDADLQNDPRDLPALLERLDGADAVIGWRHQRQDPLVKRFSSRIANWIRNRVTNENVHDTGCTLKVFRREIIGRVRMYDGMHRFLPTLVKLEGGRVEEVKVNHHPRSRGVSKYHLTNRLLGPLMDLLVVRWMQSRRLTMESEEVE